MKIALYYDSLVSKGGAERTIINLANYLDADIITSGYDPDLKLWMPIKGKVIDIGNLFIRYYKPLGVLFETPLRFYLNRNKFDYDINIFCGFSSIYGATIRNRKKNIWFCFTPNRVLYDLQKIIINNSRVFAKPVFKLYIKILSKYDQSVVKFNFQKLIAQTKNVRNRINKYYNKQSKIIYPPIDLDKFKFEKFGNYFLAVSRLYPEKRMDLIAKAFSKIPDKNLVLVGDGPEKNKIIKIIKSSKNIQLVDNISDLELHKLYSNCYAVIYMPIDEDFGLVPLEGMASGKICIAADEGGCKETVIDGKTGFLIKATENNIINIVNNLSVNQLKKMKLDCIKQAKNFGISKCIREWKNELNLGFLR